MVPVLARPAPRRRPRAVPPFSPADLAGLTVWLADGATYQDAARTVPATADADLVYTWADASGAGNHLVQATAGQRPTYRPNERSGLPAVDFDGVNDWLKATFTLNQPVTGFLVCRFPPASNAYFLDGATGAPGTAGSIGSFAANKITLLAHGSLQVDSSAVFAFGAWVVISWVLNGATSEIYRNGALVGSGATGTNPMGGLTLGTLSSAIAYWFGSEMGEVLLYAGALGTTDRQAVEAYLAGKWMTPREPIEVAGCGGWWRGDEGTFTQDSAGTVPAVADGDPVGLWANKMPPPTSTNLTQAQVSAPDRRPVLKLNLVNGKHALRFDGVDDWLTGGTLGGALVTAAAGVVYVVFRATGFNNMSPAPETGDVFLTDGIWGDTTARAGLSLTGNTPMIHAWNSETGAEVDTDIARLPLAANTWYAHAWRHAGGTLTSRLGTGTPPAAEASVASGNWVSTGVFRLGANFNGAFPAHVDVAEVFCFTVDPSPADAAALELYLRQRYLS